MLIAWARAVSALSLPELRRVVGLSLGLAVVSFVALWIAAGYALHAGARFAFWPLDWAVEMLGALAVMALSWLLFPAVLTMVMGLFLDRVAAAVEARDYPGKAAARRVPLSETAMMTLRLMGLTIIVNLLALPVYLLAPGVNFFVFLGLNGYLFGREYFEVVALRRLDAPAVAAMRNRFAGRVFLGGVAVAGLFAVPFVNLVMPIVATAFMVHLFEDLRRRHPQYLIS